MAESVDALVSNTSGAIRAGSTPAQGTESQDRQFGPAAFVLSSVLVCHMRQMSNPIHMHHELQS